MAAGGGNVNNRKHIVQFATTSSHRPSIRSRAQVHVGVQCAKGIGAAVQSFERSIAIIDDHHIETGVYQYFRREFTNEILVFNHEDGLVVGHYFFLFNCSISQSCGNLMGQTADNHSDSNNLTLFNSNRRHLPIVPITTVRLIGNELSESDWCIRVFR